MSQLVRKGGQLKGTKHRGEMTTYYQLLSLLMKKNLRKSEMKEKLGTDGIFMKKTIMKLRKASFIQEADDTRFPRYKITQLGVEFMVYLKVLEKSWKK